MKNKIDLYKILYEICEDKLVYEKDINLIESGLLDSYAFILLFSTLEDYGVFLEPPRIDRSKLATVSGIQELIDDYLNKNIS